MDDAATSTVWNKFDPQHHAGRAGIYIFLIRAFGNAPYYVGQTSDLSRRLRDHRNGFGSGARTFMRDAFIEGAAEKTHAGFARRWTDFKTQESQLVWVPTGKAETDAPLGHEGAAYWDRQVSVLVSLNDTDREAIEKRIQIDLGEYYEQLEKALDWSLARTRLMGQIPPGEAKTAISYCWQNGPAMSAPAFFSSLEQISL